MAVAARTSDREVVHNRIPLLRADRGISRAELAEALGIHYQTVGYIERGEYAPSLHLALRLAAFFGLPVEAVFSLEPFEQLGAAALLVRRAPDKRSS
jgi:DNA-binding XRE family transcriptional regulator